MKDGSIQNFEPIPEADIGANGNAVRGDGVRLQIAPPGCGWSEGADGKAELHPVVYPPTPEEIDESLGLHEPGVSEIAGDIRVAADSAALLKIFQWIALARD